MVPHDGSVTTTEPRESLFGSAFVLVTVSTFAYFVGVGVLLPVLPRLVKTGIGGSNWDVGLMTASYSIAAIACRPFLAWFTRRFGRRLLMLWGSLLGGIGMTAAVPVHAIVPLVALRLVAGVAEAMFFVGAATIVTELAPPTRRAEATSYNSVGVFSGLGLGPVIGEWFARDAHYGRAFAVAGLCAVVSFAFGWFVPADRPAVDVPVRRSSLLHRGGLGTGSALALGIAGYAGWSAFLALRADEIGHVNAGEVFLLYSVLTLLFRLFGARVPERVGLGRCAASSFVMFTIALLSAALIDGAAGLWISAALISLAVALMYPALLALTVDGIEEAHERADVLTTFTMFFEVGGALGGIVLGQVAQRSSYQGSFAAGAVLSACAIPVVWFAVLAPRRAQGVVTPDGSLGTER